MGTILANQASWINFFVRIVNLLRASVASYRNQSIDLSALALHGLMQKLCFYFIIIKYCKIFCRVDVPKGSELIECFTIHEYQF